METKEIKKDFVNLENGIVLRIDNKYLSVQIGHDNIECEDCDSYLDYTLYSSEFEDIDGGQLDYDSHQINYQKYPEKAIKEILTSFHLNDQRLTTD